MPLPLAACSAKRRRRICIAACLTTLVTTVGPSVGGNLVMECVGVIMDRALP